MSLVSSPSHVAVLVPSARRAADVLSSYGFLIGEEEVFEETKEIYVDGGQRNSLLLMEPLASGSYRRALDKRGPGVHHMAIDVLDLDSYLASLSGSGWLLHLNSLKTISSLRTAYLARPGFPGLIEVQQKKILDDGALFVEEVSLPFSSELIGLVTAIGLTDVVTSGSRTSLLIRGRRIEISELI